MKRCKHCGIEKPVDDFYTDRKAKDGRRPECKACNLARRRAKYAEDPRPYIDRVMKWQRENPERVREYLARFNASGKRKQSNRKSHLKRKYGLTPEAFDEMLAMQGGGCAICGKPNPDNVDHDHVTGRVRGILCWNCNVGVGQFEDDIERLITATAYLDRDEELEGLARERTVALSA